MFGFNFKTVVTESVMSPFSKLDTKCKDDSCLVQRESLACQKVSGFFPVMRPTEYSQQSFLPPLSGIFVCNTANDLQAKLEGRLNATTSSKSK